MLKKQSVMKKRLQKELSERCYQMGIPALEEPKICWNVEQFRWYTSIKEKHLNKLGQASFKTNTILVDLNHHKHWKNDFMRIRETLVHELVHMRWQHQRHGSTFNELIKRVLKGEKFPIRTRPSKYYPTYT